MKIVITAKERLCHFYSAYAPQTGCSDQAKDEFWSLLDEKTAEVPSKDVIIVAGDPNGHVGATKGVYSPHGGFGYGLRKAPFTLLMLSDAMACIVAKLVDRVARSMWPQNVASRRSALKYKRV
ncbi:unnamed protein product [Heligmosomoides polygyrus]|uniref:Craniofacial development protein 2-like n=1 Tax=Heligmosomoides polygyrus TaxID=6339 RepID=A0A183GIS8_HELPZ|nr:unnamed protein product [Heligmosomoides polygyrus]